MSFPRLKRLTKPQPNQLRRQLCIGLLLLLLAACTPPDPEPTADPNAPTLIATLPQAGNTPTFTPQSVPEERPLLDAITNTPDPNQPIVAAATSALPAGATPIQTPFIVNSGGASGVRPGDAVIGEITSVPALSPEWRPPPYLVPLALHPNDHFWFIRPIPSGNRNFDLEWYPFGNDVLIPELAPYRVHHGLDFPNDPGTPILAAADGVVVFAGIRTSPRNGINYYGNTIIIQHDAQWQGEDIFTLYAHTLEMFVAEGDRVMQGQLIAGVGQTGSVSGPHLHLEVRIGSNNYFDVRNPILWLAPFEGYGVLAGRFVDDRGVPIRSGRIVVKPLNVDTFVRNQLTYYNGVVKPDDFYQENFVVGDLPAGRYVVELTSGDRTYARTIEIQPGRTNFIVVQADVTVIPTVTPTLAIVDTPEISGTVTITGTIPAVPSATSTP